MTVVGEKPPPQEAEGSTTSGMPTIVDFGVVILLSAALLAPWQAITPAGRDLRTRGRMTTAQAS